MLAMAQEKGYPIRFQQKLTDTKLYTYLGRYRTAAGTELTYTLPVTPYLNRTIAPVRIVGSARPTS